MGDKWTVDFSWVKAHIGNYGNELADRLAKQAARDANLQTCYDMIPLSAVKAQLIGISEDKWQREWELTSKGSITKSFFPKVKDRLNLKIQESPRLNTLVTGHKKINAYFYRFKIKDSAMCVCVCGVGKQSVDHILYECIKLNEERDILIQSVKRSGGNWPVDKETIAKNYINYLTKFANSIDLEKLQ